MDQGEVFGAVRRVAIADRSEFTLGQGNRACPTRSISFSVCRR